MNLFDQLMGPAHSRDTIDNVDRFIVAFSGGKDSVAMVLMLLDLGVPNEKIHLHHHDVDGEGGNLFDWPCTKSYCEHFAEVLDLKLIVSGREGGIRREIMRENEGLQDVYYYHPDTGERVVLKSRKGSSTRRKFPAVAADLRTRWCSSVAKIDVLSRVIVDLYPKKGTYWILTGERRQESNARSKYKDHEDYRANTQTRKAIQIRPIIDWDETQVWDIMKRWGIVPHPCYYLGWSRCSCQICIFSSANLWATNEQIAPEKIGKIASIEDNIEHTMYNKKTILQKVLDGMSIAGSSENFDSWAKIAMNEVYTGEIKVGSLAWKLPAGAYGEEKAGSI